MITQNIGVSTLTSLIIVNVNVRKRFTNQLSRVVTEDEKMRFNGNLTQRVRVGATERAEHKS